MKKAILFMLFLSIMTNTLFASKSVVSPISTLTDKKYQTQKVYLIKMNNAKFKVMLQVCTTTVLPICHEGQQVGSINANVCAANQEALMNLISSFQCSGGNQQ